MVKVYCDICGNEILKANEIWKLSLLSKPGNPRVSYDEIVEDMCESCATKIHCRLVEMKHGLEQAFDRIPKKGDGNG